MVKASLKKVFIKNFKSLHDCEIDIEKMNVVVGANASGKSNLIEAFRLLKKIYVDKDINPFSEWWGYNNVVWQRKEELPIIIGLLFDIEGYEIYFETNCSGVGGKFQILREVLDIKDYLYINKEGEWVTIFHNSGFIENVIKNIHGYEVPYGGKKRLKNEEKQLIKGKKFRGDLEQRLLESGYIKDLYLWETGSGELIEKNTGKKFTISTGRVPKISPQKDEKVERITIFSPAVNYESKYYPTPLYNIASDVILSTMNKLLILYPLNIRLIKNPQPFRREEKLKEDGTNISSVYHTIYLKEGKIPEEIYNPLSIVFPKIDVRPHITDDGRVMIKFYEEGFELLPPNTSDGIYKILTVLIAIYLKPPLLIIDEIENSLHPETLELILDTIKASDIQAIITTHSPVVVDMTEPDDMILVEKEQGESRFKRIKDPDKIRDFLKKKGITFSTGWLYGEISHIE
ncbi:DNA replication and repair protein RecF [uncultured archaeon]|nr:DNA replication and repair protein RecF [uncultured archaeon]